MKYRKLLTLVLTAFMVLTMTLTGCGKDTSSTGVDNGEMDKEQVLNLPSVADLATLDSAITDDGYALNALNACMEGLVRIINKGDKDELESAGAESWTTSPDGLTWTFKLRDYKWTDDKAVTANDYVYAIRRLLNKDTAAPYSYLFYGIKNGLKCNNGECKPEDVGVKAVDEKTLQFTLEYPIPYFLQLMAMKCAFPQRQDIVEREGKSYGQDPKKMVFNGPFVVDDWIHTSKIVFKKNAKYWDAKSVKLDTVNVSVIKEETPRMTMLKDGQIDAGTAKGQWVNDLQAAGKFNIVSGVLPSTSYEYFNMKTPLFKSPKVRLAIALALDREDLIKTIYEGRYKPAYGWIPDGIVVQNKIDYRKQVQEPLKTAKEKYSTPETLKALFKEGLKENGMDPEKVYTFKYLQSGTDTFERTMGEWLKNLLETRLPIKVELDSVNDFPEFISRLRKQEYEMAGLRASGDYNDPMTFLESFQTGYDGNYGAYSNKEYDSLIQQSIKESDPQKRFEIFKKAEQILIADDPAITPMAYFDKMTFVEKYVKDLMLPQFGADYEFKYAYIQGKK